MVSAVSYTYDQGTNGGKHRTSMSNESGSTSWDIAVLRDSNGMWYIMGQGYLRWYLAGDYPLPVRDTNADGDAYE